MDEKIIILPDVHLDDKGYKPVYGLVKKYIEDEKPDEVVLLGDFMDMASLSHWNDCKRRKLENKRYALELETGNKELDFLQKHAKKVTYIEGNHEHWCQLYIDKNPEMEGFMELQDALGLKERGIAWFPENKLYKKGHLYLTHGHYINMHHAKKHLEKFGCCIVYGHSHNPQQFSMNMKMQDPLGAWGLGCLCDHEPEYLRGRPANWRCQFAVVFMKGKNFNIYPVDIIKNKFVAPNGVTYE